MRQMDFETNIELRVPSTGKVYMIDRMTSDWAERHPLNVDQLIEDVYQEFAGTEFEESREALRKVWTATLSVRNPQGDASIYPNNNGARRAAAMKIWHTAGDYWRRGLRQGDTLPERCPSCKITRLEDGGWIALFPKDMHLLEKKESTLTKIDNDDDDVIDVPNPNLNLTMMAEPRQMELFDTEEEHHHPEAVEVEAVMKQTAETDENEAEASVLAGEPSCNKGDAPARSQAATRQADERRKRRTEQRERQRMTYMERMEREAREAEEAAREEERRKIFAAVGALAVTAVMIYFFGLLGPAVFGLLCGGLLKG